MAQKKKAESRSGKTARKTASRSSGEAIATVSPESAQAGGVVPASLEEVFARGFRWQRESFANLREFGGTPEGVTRREGLAHFVSDSDNALVIPFVATYEFGAPRIPKHPWSGGSVFSVDEDPEPEPVPEPIQKSLSVWKVDMQVSGVVCSSMQVWASEDGEAIDYAIDDLNDEILFYASEVDPRPDGVGKLGEAYSGVVSVPAEEVKP